MKAFHGAMSTRFRGNYGFGVGIVLDFRLEGGRAARVTVERGSERREEMKRVS